MGGSVLFDSFCRVLGGGAFRDSYPDYEDLPSWQSSKDTVSGILRTHSEYDKYHNGPFLNSVNRYGRGKYFFATEDGEMGGAPKAARAGDIVCVILGCAVPLILRETEEARYQVVGIPLLSKDEMRMLLPLGDL